MILTLNFGPVDYHAGFLFSRKAEKPSCASGDTLIRANKSGIFKISSDIG